MPKLRGAPPRPSSVLVIVPARDEAGVVGDLIADLGRQDVVADPTFDVRVVVVDDGSLDGTGEAARGAVARAGLVDRSIVFRRETPTTKSAALACAIDAVRRRTSLPDDTAIVVVDSDARIRPDFLRRAVGAAAGAPATARRRMLVPPPRFGPLAALGARLQDDEETVDHLLRRLRFAVGGSGELRGDGMVLPVAALDLVGGWPVDALCEDLEVSTALTLRTGLRVRPLEVEVWEQPVLDLVDLVRQRLRWAEGAIRRDLRLVWPYLADSTIPLRRRVDAVAYASQTLVGPVLGIFVLGRRPGRAVVRTVLGGYALAGIALASAALAPYTVIRRPSDGLRLVARSIGVVGFAALWPIVTSVAWLRIVLGVRSEFRRTPKVAGFSAPGGGDHDPLPRSRTGGPDR